MHLFILLAVLVVSCNAKVELKRESKQDGGNYDIDQDKSCPALRLKGDIIVDPPSCRNGPQSSGTTCHFRCNHGYRVAGPPMTMCQDDGAWFFGHKQITCVDIDECRFRNGGCSHKCTNTDGGYHCECPEPLVLDKTGKNCRAVGLVLNCSAHDIEVIIPKYALNDVKGNVLQLRDPTCHARENKTHYVFKTELNGCGTTRRNAKRFLVYSNKVTERHVVRQGVITRIGKDEFNIPFCCYYLDNAIIGAVGYKPFVRELVLKEKGFGKFKLRMDFYHSQSYKNVYTWDDYPVSVYLRQRLYFEVSLDSKDPNLMIFASNCYATPTREAKARRVKHDLIRDGCIVDSTTQRELASSPHQQRFSVSAFQFVGKFPFVYLHCSVMVCKADDPSSRCRQGCPNAPHFGGKPQIEIHERDTAKHAQNGEKQDKRTLPVRHTRALSKKPVHDDKEYMLSKGPVSLLEDEPQQIAKEERAAEPQSDESSDNLVLEKHENSEAKASVESSTTSALILVLIGLTVLALVGVLYVGRKVKEAKTRGMSTYRPMKS